MFQNQVEVQNLFTRTIVITRDWVRVAYYLEPISHPVAKGVIPKGTAQISKYRLGRSILLGNERLYEIFTLDGMKEVYNMDTCMLAVRGSCSATIQYCEENGKGKIIVRDLGCTTRVVDTNGNDACDSGNIL